MSIPGTKSRARIELRKNLVAGRVDPFEFLVLKGRFGIQFRGLWRCLQVFGNILGQPFSLKTETDKSSEALELFSFPFLGILPVRVELVHVRDLKLVNARVALLTAIRFQLIRQRLILRLRRALDLPALAGGEVRLHCLAYHLSRLLRSGNLR